jgi:transcriptional regulator with XRE-family HTH domain
MTYLAVKNLRKEKGYTQNELEMLARLPKMTISHIETGRRPASLKQLKRIASVLDVKLDDLI